MNLYLDCEFTGLRQHTSLISLALVADQGREFYAEFSDFDAGQCDSWISENVIAQTRWLKENTARPGRWQEGDLFLCFGDRTRIRDELDRWLAEFDTIEVWADCAAWDWVLFCELFGGAFHIPRQIFYLPFDLVTLFKLKGIDPNIDRETFSGFSSQASAHGRHHALHDARVLKACYDKLTSKDECNNDE